MHLVASVCLSVRPSVRLFALSRLNRLSGYVGQGRRSRSYAKKCFTLLLPDFKVKVKGRVKVEGQGQRSGSRSKVKVNLLAHSGRYQGLGFAECTKGQ